MHEKVGGACGNCEWTSERQGEVLDCLAGSRLSQTSLARREVEMGSLRASGTSKVYDEHTQLLIDLSVQIEDAKK